jgi:hypothetical protein
MTAQATALELDSDGRFTTPDGAELDVRIGRLHRSVADSPHVTADLVVDHGTWADLVEQDCFHLYVLDQYLTFEPGEDVELRVVLQPRIADELPDSGVEIASRLEDPADPLCRTDSWFLTEAYQLASLTADDGDERTAARGEESESGDDESETGDDEARFGVTTRWAEFFATDGVSSVTDTVREYLEDAGWAYELLDEDLFQFAVVLDEHRQWPMFVHTDDPTGTCLFYAVFPERVPAERRGDAAVTVAARNYERTRGSFGLDPADGEVRFRLAVVPEFESLDYALETTVDAMFGVYDDLAELVATEPRDWAGEDDERDGMDEMTNDETDRIDEMANDEPSAQSDSEDAP